MSDPDWEYANRYYNSAVFRKAEMRRIWTAIAKVFAVGAIGLAGLASLIILIGAAAS